jgi:hypothetical protein
VFEAMTTKTEYITQWAKERFDEIEATIKLFDKQISTFDEKSRAQAQKLLDDMKRQRDAFQEKLQILKHQGGDTLTHAKDELEKNWDTFETFVQRFLVEARHRTEVQEEAFRVRIEAQRKAWSDAIETTRKETSAFTASAKQHADAFLKEFQAQAEKVNKDLEAKAKAHEAGWDAFKSALLESRAAFDQAIAKSREAFKKVA